MNGLQVPGRLSIGVQTINAPNAQPGVVTLPHPGGLQVFVVGGLTKLEHFAIELAKTERTNDMDPMAIAEMAGQLIQACNMIEHPPEPKPEEAEKASPILTE